MPSKCAHYIFGAPVEGRAAPTHSLSAPQGRGGMHRLCAIIKGLAAYSAVGEAPPQRSCSVVQPLGLAWLGATQLYARSGPPTLNSSQYIKGTVGSKKGDYAAQLVQNAEKFESIIFMIPK